MRKDESEPQESAKEVTPSKKPKTGNAQSSQSAQAGLETEIKSTKKAKGGNSKKTEKESESAEARDT